MTRRRIELLLGLSLLGVSMGCGVLFRGTLPPRSLYRLSLPDSAALGRPLDSASRPAGDGRAALPGSLGIMRYETPGLYGESNIVYRVGDTEYATYPNREWALPLGEMLGLVTARVAGSHALALEPALYDPPSPRKQTYLWRARVREFEEVDRGNSLFVAVRIDATIVRTRDDSVVWSGSAGRERAVEGGSDMSTVVRALSEAAASVIGELLDRAEQDLVRSGAALPTAADTARRAP
jgi:ABC-type uncharacterized transport system auxiliary subunit